MVTLVLAERFAPDLVGVTLNTRWVWYTYRWVEKLAKRLPLLLAGGPHFKHARSGKCLTNPSTGVSNGKSATIPTCDGGQDQQWDYYWKQ